MVVENDDGISYCCLEKLPISFIEEAQGDSILKPWPITYFLPPINKKLEERILSIKSAQDSTDLKNDHAFCMSFTDMILGDIKKYLDESK
ncbi:MAG: hypothetical protein AAGK05_13980 [Pseudomonadota bacterium]